MLSGRFYCATASAVPHAYGLLFFVPSMPGGPMPVPEELSAVEAAPLMCAGITTFNCLRNSGASSGEVVAVLGLGGLGHLVVQNSAKMGF